MAKQSKLGNIADIQFGLHQKSQASGEIKYLLVRHFDENLKPTLFEGSFISNDDARVGRAMLEPNDVLFAGKGFRQFAWAYDKSLGTAIASSVFYVIKPDPSIILSEYLAITLNSDRMKHVLKAIGLGATIPSIPIKELREIKIPIPPMEDQRKIVEYAKLHQQEIAITQQLLQKKKEIFKSFIKKAID